VAAGDLPLVEINAELSIRRSVIYYFVGACGVILQQGGVWFGNRKELLPF
jgi:hypothetical protein